MIKTSQAPTITLRDYQQDAIEAALNHFRQSRESAVLVLPTGAGKSLVIAELARIAKGRVLVLTHVKELVAQNAEKVALMAGSGSIYSAGLGEKDSGGKTVIAGIQSAARNLDAFSEPFSLVIIDECHRVSQDKDSQYHSLFAALKAANPNLLLLGLTATPYRLGEGYIHKRHVHGHVGNPDKGVFDVCIFELPMRVLIKKGFLTPPRLLDGLAAQYNFANLKASEDSDYSEAEVESVLNTSGRATTAIVGQLKALGASRRGVIIFAATVRHAKEVLALLERGESKGLQNIGMQEGEASTAIQNTTSAALITADTDAIERDRIINAFKAGQIRFLVNVSVLTTGFDAPHVDLIAILRPTASVSLFQQMVGRGLRLYPGKTECLILDYAANGFSLFHPEVGKPRPDSKSVPVQVPCPACGFANLFWGKTDQDGDIIEHFGRRCQGIIEDGSQCDFRYRARICPDCGAENDIAARICRSCDSALVDPDKHLKAVLAHKHHHLFKVADMQLSASGNDLLISYQDMDGNPFEERFKMQTDGQRKALFAAFLAPHQRAPGVKLPRYKQASEIVADRDRFKMPELLLLKKGKFGWQLLEKFFDYTGKYQSQRRFETD
ncbi:DEAD/DEAH box helicase [Shewanella sp. JM162201]|uniref:DEAD/DEAH box helicase n=1 Tax=Shewanella jiangmenensis TaxID=2837387 RepID=A0ABS5V5R9_9GAMM|nr:DEAD/DEAH box helicase [Shewanella jiangmenensis]MBT1445799.1 DEAD/DEAH box helicase [Shewanella jiangmenensis]